MYTRLLEHDACRYSGLACVTLREINGNSLIFDGCVETSLKRQQYVYRSILQTERLCSLQIDILREDIFRVRYAEGNSVPTNDTPMVVGRFDAAPFTLIENEREYAVSTGPYKLIISKSPYSLVVYDAQGVRKFAASMGEANEFRVLDAFNIGLVRNAPEGPAEFFPPHTQHEREAVNRPGEDITLAVESFELAPDEHLYGFGEHFTGLDKKYQTIDLFTQEAFGPCSSRMYKPVPFFVSSRGYGVYVNTHCPLTVWAGSMSNLRTVVAVEDDFVDYYVMLGATMKQAIREYLDVTGQCSLPPKWSFGFWLSRWSYKSEAEAREAVTEMRRRKLPFDVLHHDSYTYETDWHSDFKFSSSRYPDVTGYMRFLKENGVHASLWQMPNIASTNELYAEAFEKGYFPTKDSGPYQHVFRHADGTPVFSYRPDQTETVISTLDMTNPEAVAWWQGKIRSVLGQGVSAIKTDFGEYGPTGCVYANGMPGRKAHNLYPLLYMKAVYEVTKEFTDQPIFWGRSTWAGCQRYPTYWGGDNSGTFEQLVPQLTGGLSFMMSGFPFWSQDIAGYNTEIADLELYVRWFQIGLFMPHARIHGVGLREPFRFCPDVEDSVRKALNLRYRLIPYIYSSAWESVRDGVPLMRPLPLEFEGDRNVSGIQDEFMFGHGLLAAPVMNSGGRRRVYLPEGVWHDFWANERFSGGRWVGTESEIDRFPLYLRQGAIIPMGPVMQFVGEIPVDPITLLVCPGEDSDFTYYDDADSFDIHLRGHCLTLSGVAAGHTVEVLLADEGVVASAQANGVPVLPERQCGFTLIRLGNIQGNLRLEWE